MVKLTPQQLGEIFRWAQAKRNKKGLSLLERARESIKAGSYLKYNTTTELKDGLLLWDCNCPDAQRRKDSDAPCKHVIAWLILSNEDTLRTSSRAWDEWFREYHATIEDEVIRAFDQF